MDAGTRQRFWDKVSVINDETSCWEWQGSIVDGYGKFRDNSKNGTDRAHRISYRLEYGELSEGEEVLHRCDNRKCCRPDHLFRGTIQMNVQDMMSKGRQAKGEKKANSKLTDDAVLSIRQRHAAGEALAALAHEHHVSARLLSQVCCGDIWKHVGGPLRVRRTYST